MHLEAWVKSAKELGASDLHLEAGFPMTLRIRGTLRPVGDRIPGAHLVAAAQDLLGDERWAEFLERCSADLSQNLAGVRCRVNIFRSARGVGLAIRLLTVPAVGVRSLNLHPDLLGLVQPSHGLVIVAGPTGCGKSS